MREQETKGEIKAVRTDIIKYDQMMDRMSIDGRRPMREQELKQYMAALRAKTEKYKQCKTKLQTERNELSILQRTNEILRGRDPLLAEYLQNKETQKKMESKRKLLAAVGAQKQALDKEKEAKLTNL